MTCQWQWNGHHSETEMYNRFMEALDWVDKTYAAKHESDDPQDLRGSYFPNLSQYTSDLPPITKSRKKSPFDGISVLFIRYGKRGMMALTIYLLSYVPYVGHFILPVLSFYTLDRAIGIKPAVAIFASGLVLPKRYLIWFLQTFFSSRSMMNELVSDTLHLRYVSAANRRFSSNHTSVGFTLISNRNGRGFKSAKESCLVLEQAFSFCLKFLYAEF